MLEAEDSIIVLIDGPLDLSQMENNGYSLEVCSFFLCLLSYGPLERTMSGTSQPKAYFSFVRVAILLCYYLMIDNANNVRNSSITYINFGNICLF